MKLNPREAIVLGFIAQDLTTGAIAEAMKITQKAVEWHITRLKRKFNCGLVGLARIALQHDPLC